MTDAESTLLEQVREALELPILFHAGGEPNRARWEEIVGPREMTTRVMCDHIRAVIARIDEQG